MHGWPEKSAPRAHHANLVLGKRRFSHRALANRQALAPEFTRADLPPTC